MKEEIITKEIKYLLKTVIGAGVNFREELNYAYYDNNMIVATDSNVLVRIVDIKLDIPNRSFIAIREMKSKLLIAKIDTVYPDTDKIIPRLEPVATYDNIYDFMQDKTLNFPVYNLNLMKMLTTLRKKEVAYMVYNSIYCVKHDNISIYFMPQSHKY